MKEYNPEEIEKKWQKEWTKKKAYTASNTSLKKKFYVLDMFPYPSGSGLHVGHPKGYIGGDVFSRFKRMQGYNVLHPMGYDAFGLPAEQYAITHNIHPREAVMQNIQTFEKQLSIIGLSYDWSRKVNTTDPEFYKWTQWIFLKLYGSWYNKDKEKAEPIETLIKKFEKEGNVSVNAATDQSVLFSKQDWKQKTEKEKQEILMKYRLAFEGESEVNWCSELGTVLANDEVVEGPNGELISERGGFPVEKRNMRQWFMRITAYADRLLLGLETLTWPGHIKEIERNWIGKSEGSEIEFLLSESEDKIKVFTTRPDTLFGVTYIVLSRQHELISKLLLRASNKEEVEKYISEINNKSLQDEKSHAEKEKTGVHLCGISAVNPINGEKIPVFVADYVLAGYGTGAVMAVPAHDERDFEFAEKYGLPIKEVVVPNIIDVRNPPMRGKKAVERKNVHPIVLDPKTGKYLALKWKKFDWTTFPMGGVEDGEDIIAAARREIKEETGFVNVRFVRTLPGLVRAEYFAAHKDINRVSYTQAVLFELEDHEQVEIEKEEKEAHDIVWLTESQLSYDHMTHAEIETWKKRMDPSYVTYTGEGVLINSGEFSGMDSETAKIKITKAAQGKRVTKYKMRNAVFARQRYWGEPIPLWHDKDGIIHELPEKSLPLKLPDVVSYKPSGTGESPLATVPAWVKKGLETNTMPGWAGSSWYFLRYMDPKNKKKFADPKAIKYWKNVDVYVGGAEHATGHLLYARFWHKFLKDCGLVVTEEPFQTLKNQGMILGSDNRKMSKRWGNVVNPDDVVRTYGADTLRVYEMFMGPFDSSLPWSTENIIGSRRFIERVWRLSSRVSKGSYKFLNTPEISKFETLLHKTIQKITADIENFTFNTSISALMILLNEMEKTFQSEGEKNNTIPQAYFEVFLKLLSPFAPHVTEELWHMLGHKTLIVKEKWPKADPKKMKEDVVQVVVQVNSKVRGRVMVSPDTSETEVLKAGSLLPEVSKWLEGKKIQKIIYIRAKLLNIVVS